jgi:Xaa-Pro aminopeptidase
MLSLKCRLARRRRFLEMLERPAILFAGGERPRSSPFHTYPYRADNNFLLFFDRPEPGSAAFFDPGDGQVTLFLPDRTVESATWSGELPPFASVRERESVHAVLAVENILPTIPDLLRGREVVSLAVGDPHATAMARTLTGQDLAYDDPSRIGPREIVDALASLRLRKEPEDLSEIRRAAEVTGEAHLAVWSAVRAGVSERELAARMEEIYLEHGCANAYGTILSVRGEILHNPHHDGVLQDGDLLLVDSGAEAPSGYGADVTRTWPVSGTWEGEARAIYEIVLAAQKTAISLVRPGARYCDVHFGAARVMAEGLAACGLLEGEPDALVKRGAHALFSPHGIGHLLGLETHDLRTFGDRILYASGRARSEEFGANMLRMDLDLEPGMVVTIEPGIYFVPAILRREEFRAKFRDAVDFELAERYLTRNDGRGFGGIRIEDDIVVTANGSEVLTAFIPKEISEIEHAGPIPGEGMRATR